MDSPGNGPMTSSSLSSDPECCLFIADLQTKLEIWTDNESRLPLGSNKIPGPK